MPPKHPRRRSRRRGENVRDEWVGGVLTTPFYVAEGGPYRPEMVLWLEQPEEFIVASTVIDSNGPPLSFGETLRRAIASPLVGPPRRPACIRVATARLAAEAQAEAPDIEVVVAPTPELDGVFRLMAGSFSSEGQDEASYFEGGNIQAGAIESMFHAARLLFEAAPWQVADDSQVLRLDIPALDVEGACVSIIGALGESLGVIIFPSLEAYDSILDAMDAPGFPDWSMDLGTSALCLNFDHGADVPASMRREVAEHGWTVAGPDAFPSVQHRDRDGLPRPLTEHDLRIVTACATSLAAFFLKHRRLFERETFEPVCESFVDESDLEVRFTVPYEAGALFEVNVPQPPEPPTRKVGRNAPCPCGSGRKYKHCCLPEDQAARAPARLHEIDQRLVDRMLRYATERFGDAWLRAAEDFHDCEVAESLFFPWAAYHVRVDGKPIVGWFLESHGRRLSGSERAWLEAQHASWLSVWEVTAVEPGSSLTLEDLLTGETRTIAEVRGSRTLARRDAILGRVVDQRGLAVLGGTHPRPLPPMEAAEVVRRVRARLRRRRAVPPGRLREEKISRYLIARWEEAVADLDERRSIPPRLHNTDGEALLLTVDHFELGQASREEIEQRLRSLDGVDPPQPDERIPSYTFTRPGNALHRGWENTVIGRAVVSADGLRLETNSVGRADAMRARIEAACGDLIRHRAREHSDPFARMQDDGERAFTDHAPAGIPPEDEIELIREFKRKHYADWIDQPLPALGGQTPREAVRSKAGRDQVELLLKDCENHEARLPAAQRFDFSDLRRALGFDR